MTGNENGLIGYWPLDSVVDNITPDLTVNQNDLNAYTKFVNTTPQSPAGNVAHLVVDTSPIDLGSAELNKYLNSGVIGIQNSGDAPLYGEVSVNHQYLETTLYGKRYFADPGGSGEISLYVRPLRKGDHSSVISFSEGNADNQGLQVPITIEGVRELGIDANNIDMWIHPNGVFAFNYQFHESGLEWPKFSNKHVVFSSGVWVGAKVGSQIHTAISAGG